MTRENKLALVVGFGLVLLVGILVSDHLSPAQNNAIADMTGQAAPVPPRAQYRGDLAVLRTSAPPIQRHDDAERDFIYQDAEPAVQDRRVEARPQPRPETAVPPMAAPRFQKHHVAPGETLIHVSRKYYKTDDLAPALARHNNITNPSMVQVGHRLDIPPREILTGEASKTPTKRQASPREPRTHKVARNESLWKIAAKHLGDGNRFTEIFELNRDQLKDADDVRPGMTLRIPAA